MRRSGTPGLAFSLALLLASLAGCGGGLYTAEGLPPLDAGGGKSCDPITQLDCPGIAACVDRDVSQCEACGTPCPSVANAQATCEVRAAGVSKSCGHTCNPGWLACTSGCCRPVAAAAGGDHTCAVTTDGTLRCWGENDAGQVTRTSTSASESTPVTVFASAAGFVLAAGQKHTCAVVSGQVQCWGANASGQATPPALTGTVTGLAAGQAHTCAIAGGTVTCWGDNTFGQRNITLTGLTPAARIVAGLNHTCVLAADGAVTCWGDNRQQQLAGGTPFAAGSGIATIGAGHDHTCVADGVTDGLKCWGGNPGGVVLAGLADPQPTPAVPPKEGGSGQSVVGGKVVGLIAGGRAHTCATLPIAPPGPFEPPVCFGDGTFLQLGNATPPPQNAVPVLGLTPDPRVLTGGNDHTCAITAEDELRCWGRNQLGQLGLGTTAAQPAGAHLVSGR